MCYGRRRIITRLEWDNMDTLCRFPLPAHDVPHNQEDCGDPEGCLHETPTARADVTVVQKPLPRLTEPAVAFSKRASPWSYVCDLDWSIVEAELLAASIPASQITAVSVRFVRADEAKEFAVRSPGLEDLAGWVVGWHHIGGWVDLNGEPHSVSHGIHVVIGPSSAGRINGRLWHELGHLVFRETHSQDRETLYSRPGWSRAMKRLFGRRGSKLLWLFDAEERWCDRFARRRRHLRPFTWR